MANERQQFLRQYNTQDLVRFQGMRKDVLDRQILPALTSAAAWLTYSEPFAKDTQPSLPENQSNPLAVALNRISGRLSDTLCRAETDPYFCSHYLHLYSPELPDCPAAPDFHIFDPNIFDKAVSILLNTLKGHIHLAANQTWEDLAKIHKGLGRSMPVLPEQLDYVDGQDGGYINTYVDVSLPTRAPFVFVTYAYKLRVTQPVTVSPKPRGISIQMPVLVFNNNSSLTEASRI